MGRQDARAPARAYAMKAVEDTDAPDVIVGNFQNRRYYCTCID